MLQKNLFACRFGYFRIVYQGLSLEHIRRMNVPVKAV